MDRNQPLSDSGEISQILLCHYCDRKKHLSEGNARMFTLNGVNCTKRAGTEWLAFFLKSHTTSLKRTAEGCVRETVKRGSWGFVRGGGGGTGVKVEVMETMK